MSSSSTILTRFKTAITIMTARFANSIYGGERGSELESSIITSSEHGEYDPLIAGHMHDGGQGDGHAQKINLGGTGTEHIASVHVRGELQHENLADSAVYKNNVLSLENSETNTNLIPWRVDLGSGNYRYYLNLSDYTSYLTSSLATDLDTAATLGNKTDQLIGLGSDTKVVEAQLQILGNGSDNPSSSEYAHIKLVNKNSTKSSPDVGYITYQSSNSDGLWLYAKNDSEASYGSASDSFNGLQINAYDTTTPPTTGVRLVADQGNFVVDSNSETQINSVGMATILGNDLINLETDLSSGVGIAIQSRSDASINITAHRTSGSGPGIVAETWGGSPIHIGTQTYDQPADATEEVRFTSEQFNFHSPIRSSGVGPISSYPTEDEFLNIYDKADVDGTKNVALTIDLGNKTGNSQNPSVVNNNAKIYFGHNAKSDSVERKDVSLYIRDGSGPKIYLDDLTSSDSTSPSKSGISFAGQLSPTAVSGQSDLFSEILSGKTKPSLVPGTNYGGNIQINTHGSKKLISSATTSPYSISTYSSVPRFNIDFNGNISIGTIERNKSSDYHNANGTTAYIRKDSANLLSIQSEADVESNGVGNDMVVSFGQTYSQNDTVSPKIIKDLRYMEIEAPDFVNSDTASSVKPTMEFFNLSRHTDGGTSSPSHIDKNIHAAFMNFRHPVIDESTDPTSAPYLLSKTSIEEHPMLLTNISSPTYVDSGGVSVPGKPMNTIPVSHPGFGGASDAGHYADVNAWMKVFIDEWDSGTSSWVKKMYYIPLCTLRKA